MHFGKTFVALVATGIIAGCGSQADLEEIKANQKDILAKLERLAAAPNPRGQPARPPRRGPDPSTTYAFPIGDSPVKGSPDAAVTIVEVSDFQCPYCKRVGPTLAQIAEKYGSDVRFAFKHNALSFHQRAKPAARAAECAREQGKFWEMHDALFENQRQLEDPDLEKYAGAIGVDVGEWKTCYTSNEHDARIDREQAEAVSFGARGTPAFFINGRFLSGAQPLAQFTRVIDEELAKARASGVDSSKYYAQEVVAKGQKTL